MSDQNAPKVESARFVIPFEADVSEVESALERIGDKADEIVAKIRAAFDQSQQEGATAPGSVRDAVQSPEVTESGGVQSIARAEFGQEESDGNRELVEEVKRNTDALQELRDAIEALTEAVSTPLMMEEL